MNRWICLALAVCGLLLAAPAQAQRRLSMHRARVAILAYAGKPRVRLSRCEHTGPRRVGCWVRGTCPECGPGWYFNFWTRATLRHDGHVWVAFDAFIPVRMS